MTFQSALGERRIALIQKAIGDKQLSLKEIHEAVYITRSCARYYINYLMASNKLHLCKWRHDEINGRQYWVALYAWGEGKNAKRPPKETDAKRLKRRYKERKAEDPGWYMQRLAKQRLARIKPKQDIASSWIVRN